MQIIVQEGRAVLSLACPLQAHDDSMRSTTVREITDDVKVFYRNYEVVRVEAREGALEVLPASLGGVFWVEKGRRYQLKTAD